MLSLKHCSPCSGPVDPKFKIFCFHLLRGPKIRGEGGQTSLGQKPKYKFSFFLKPSLTTMRGRDKLKWLKWLKTGSSDYHPLSSAQDQLHHPESPLHTLSLDILRLKQEERLALPELSSWFYDFYPNVLIPPPMFHLKNTYLKQKINFCEL